MSKFRFAIPALAVLLMTFSQAKAAPWAEPGDAQLRSDIETLKTYGLISGPITTWPLPWKQILHNLDDDTGQFLPTYVVNAMERVRDKAPKETDLGRVKFSAAMQATNKSSLVRSFSNTARDGFDAQASAEIFGSSTSARITVGYRASNNPDYPQDKVSLDGSYLAKAIGNWMVYGGWVDRWYGPGHESALMISTNARPMLTIGLTRLDPKPFGTKWLSWLGPWQFSLTASRMERDRDYPHALIVIMRASATPIKGLDLGVSRLMQMCGAGRPCGWSVWQHSILPFGRVLNKPGPNDPGNQQVSFDAAYSFKLSPYNFMKIYAEAMGEDGAKVLASKYARLVGATVSGPWRYDGAQWRVTAELSDTYAAGEIWGRYRQARVIYNHFVYTDGTRYFGRALGSSLDSDSLLRTIDASITDTMGRVFTIKYHHADIDRILPSPRYNRVSGNHEVIDILEAGVTWPTQLGVLDMQLRYQTDSPNTPDRKVRSAQMEMGWQISF